MKNNLANDNNVPNQSADFATPLCKRCELGGLQPKHIETAFWRNGGLMVIRNIPAMVCPTCGEEYVSDETALGLDRMRGNGFLPNSASERMIVPVFEYPENKGENG